MAVIHDLSEIVKRLPPFLPITLEEVNKKTFSVDTCTHNVLNSGAHSRLKKKVCTRSCHNLLDSC